MKQQNLAAPPGRDHPHRRLHAVVLDLNTRELLRTQGRAPNHHVGPYETSEATDHGRFAQLPGPCVAHQLAGELSRIT